MAFNAQRDVPCNGENGFTQFLPIFDAQSKM